MGRFARRARRRSRTPEPWQRIDVRGDSVTYRSTERSSGKGYRLVRLEETA